MGQYALRFSRSMADPRGFWGEAAGLIDWYSAPTAVLDGSAPHDIADGREEPVPSTIDDATVLDSLRPFLPAGADGSPPPGRVENPAAAPTDR